MDLSKEDTVMIVDSAPSRTFNLEKWLKSKGYIKKENCFTNEEARELIGDLAAEFMCEDGKFYNREVKIIEIHFWFEERGK